MSSVEERLDDLEGITSHLPNQFKELEDKMIVRFFKVYVLIISVILGIIVVPTGAVYMINNSVNERLITSNEEVKQHMKRNDSIQTELIIEYRTHLRVISNGEYYDKSQKKRTYRIK